MKPWHVELFGYPIEAGDYATFVGTVDKKIRLSVWAEKPGEGGIVIGNCCMISAGVRISSAKQITVGDDCMLASGVYLTDCDWHGIYDRVSFGESIPIRIGENVWIGDSAIVCKGVEIGENSIIGAGSVVTRGVPANVVAAGNPAKTVRHLDPEKEMIRRSRWFSDPEKLFQDIDAIDRENLKNNTLFGWIRHLLFSK
jgi:acetyltransferase-like isoleucine patch superfamily enzyme